MKSWLILFSSTQIQVASISVLEVMTKKPYVLFYQNKSVALFSDDVMKEDQTPKLKTHGEIASNRQKS